jgi:hypothetical protein
LWVPQGKETRELKWVGRRDQADLTGTWEWVAQVSFCKFL